MAEKKNANATKNVLVKATPQIVTGTLVGAEKDQRDNWRLIFDTGEMVVMPGNWSVPFDLYEGQRLRAGWDNGRFQIEDLDAVPEPVESEDKVPF